MSDEYDSDDRAGDQTEDQADKLRAARRKFQDAADHHKDAHAEAHRAARFVHNSKGKGQWEEEDISYLEENGRPVMSFNILKPKVTSLCGMYADGQRMPKVGATGGEDRLLAEVLDTVTQQLLEDSDHEGMSSRSFKTMVIQGECNTRVSVDPDLKGRGWVKVSLERLQPFEVLWDPASTEPDRSDARYVFSNRWFAEDEFKRAYPEHASEFKAMLTMGSSDGYGTGGGSGEMGEDGFGGSFHDDLFYDQESHCRYYFDRMKRMVRVIQYEWKEWHKIKIATHEPTGQRREVDDKEAARIEAAIEAAQRFGMQPEITIEEGEKEKVRVCEFVGTKILAEYDEAGPFDGFSIDPAIYEVDEETGHSYGWTRNMFDPQIELNKSKILDIESLAQRSAGGGIYENGAIKDKTTFERDLRQAGRMAQVEKGALAEGRVQLTTSQPPDVGAAQRMGQAMELLNEVSGMPSLALQTPAEQAQAGVTLAIRYNKMRQSVSDAFGNHEKSQERIVRRVMEVVTRSMPDDQIAAMLSNDDRWRIENGVIFEMTTVDGPDGQEQQVPKDRAELRKLRDLNWNVELEHRSENSTVKQMAFSTLMDMNAAGIPVPPELLADYFPGTRSDRELFKTYLENSERASAESAAMEAELTQKQMDTFAQLEAGKMQETARHNQAEETLKDEKQQADAMADFLDVLSKLSIEEFKAAQAHIQSQMGLG